MSPTLKEQMDDGLVNFRSTAYALLAENQQLRDALERTGNALLRASEGWPSDNCYERAARAALAAVRVEDDR